MIIRGVRIYNTTEHKGAENKSGFFRAFIETFTETQHIM